MDIKTKISLVFEDFSRFGCLKEKEKIGGGVALWLARLNSVQGDLGSNLVIALLCS